MIYEYWITFGKKVQVTIMLLLFHVIVVHVFLSCNHFRVFSLYRNVILCGVKMHTSSVSAVTIISGVIMLILFVSELQYYLTKEVSLSTLF